MPGPGRPFAKGQSKPARSGRHKGTPNRLSEQLVDAIAESFEELGGARFLVELARTEPRAYVALLGRVLPAQVVARAEVEQAGPVRYVIHWGKEPEAVDIAQGG